MNQAPPGENYQSYINNFLVPHVGQSDKSAITPYKHFLTTFEQHYATQSANFREQIYPTMAEHVAKRNVKVVQYKRSKFSVLNTQHERIAQVVRAKMEVSKERLRNGNRLNRYGWEDESLSSQMLHPTGWLQCKDPTERVQSPTETVKTPSFVAVKQNLTKFEPLSNHKFESSKVSSAESNTYSTLSDRYHAKCDHRRERKKMIADKYHPKSRLFSRCDSCKSSEKSSISIASSLVKDDRHGNHVHTTNLDLSGGEPQPASRLGLDKIHLRNPTEPKSTEKNHDPSKCHGQTVNIEMQNSKIDPHAGRMELGIVVSISESSINDLNGKTVSEIADDSSSDHASADVHVDFF